MLYEIRIPGAVWYEALDPNASTMEAELDLPARECRRVGRGSQFIYRHVPADVARELALYLRDRGQLMLGQDLDPRDKGVSRRAVETGERILRQIGD